MTPGQSQHNRSNKGRGGSKRKGQTSWKSEEESPAPPARKLQWRKGVGQFVSKSFDMAAMALRNRLGLNTETNAADVANGVSVGTTLSLYDNGPSIPIGATAGTGQRIGREVRVVRSLMRAYFYSPANMTGVALVRIIGVFNRQQDATPFTSAQILATNNNIMSLSTVDLTERGGTIVYDKIFAIYGTAQAPSATAQIQHIEEEFSCPDWHLSWPAADTAGAPTTNLGGALQWWCMSVGAGVTTPTLAFYSRHEYVDN